MAWDPPRPPCDPWFLKVFCECLRTTRDYVGFGVSLTSIALWMVAQFPQFYTNYKTKTVDALSPFFLAQWLLGDTGNILGCLLTGNQQPTTTYTAMYFVLSDIILLIQFVYYGSLARRRERIYSYAKRQRRQHRRRVRFDSAPRDGAGGAGLSAEGAGGAAAAAGGEAGRGVVDSVSGRLEGGGAGMESGGAAASGGDRGGGSCSGAAAYVAGGSRAHHRHKREADPVHAALGDGEAGSAACYAAASAKVAGTLACAASVGLVAAHVSLQGGLGRGDAAAASMASRVLLEGGPHHRPPWIRAAGVVAGYTSTVLYLSSRVPQIMLNHKRKSVEGLALGMFVCALGANITFGAGILIRARDWQAVVQQAPWIIGSLGTVVLDACILCQFWLYRKRPAPPPPTLPQDQEPLLRGVHAA